VGVAAAGLALLSRFLRIAFGARVLSDVVIARGLMAMVILVLRHLFLRRIPQPAKAPPGALASSPAPQP
jgi:hypothetical protein